MGAVLGGDYGLFLSSLVIFGSFGLCLSLVDPGGWRHEVRQDVGVDKADLYAVSLAPRGHASLTMDILLGRSFLEDFYDHVCLCFAVGVMCYCCAVMSMCVVDYLLVSSVVCVLCRGWLIEEAGCTRRGPE